MDGWKEFWLFAIRATVAFIIAGSFAYFFIQYRGIAQALTPWATLLLAIAAFLAIRQTRNIQKAEKRERLLNEIIEWAIDVAKPILYDLNLTLLTSSTISEKDQIFLWLLGWASDTDILITRGEYMAKIALIFPQDLRIALEKARHDLGKHDKLISDSILGKGTPETISKMIAESSCPLGRAANKVIEEAAKSRPEIWVDTDTAYLW